MSGGLERLGPTGFQDLAAGLAVAHFGPGVQVMGAGRDGVNVQVIADAAGRLVWASAALPGSTHESPAGRPLVRRAGSALIDAAATLTADGHGDKRFLLARLRLMISTPALQARHLDNHHALQQAIVAALAGDVAEPDAAFRAASACLAAMHTALVRWAEDDGRTGLPGLIAEALTAALGDVPT